MTYQLYWGDLHSHCSISYGYGTVEQALDRAGRQLDFCSITGHAFWPDMPTDRDRYGEIIDYHNEGFARLAGNWRQLIDKQAAVSQDGRFVVFPSYEWHSLKYGDHNVYARGPDLKLQDSADVAALQQLVRKNDAIAVPHHIGYAAGYRGIDWRYFQGDASPLVEIFSLHGCSESGRAPYPMLHDMGPRDAAGTAEAGWQAGHRFGVIASTDHHGGYPGSHGDGRVAVLAESLSRQSLWEAFLARRVYAVTGDKIDARMTLDDAPIGSVVSSGATRRLSISVSGSAALDCVELLKNGRCLTRLFPEADALSRGSGRYRLRVTWGWGRKDEPARWQARLSLSEGSIRQIETCFSGQAVVAPKGVAGHGESADEEGLPHELTEQGPRHCAWRSVTTGNLSMRHATTQALSLEVEAPLGARATFEVNGQRFQHELAELLAGGRSHPLRGWLSETIHVGPLTPLERCRVTAEIDDEPAEEVDIYRLRVRQSNDQWAWLTPIWVER